MRQNMCNFQTSYGQNYAIQTLSTTLFFHPCNKNRAAENEDERPPGGYPQ